MADELRAFRWLGSSGFVVTADGKVLKDGPSASGVLHLWRPDGKTRVVRPGQIVRDPEGLALLGQARIEELVNEGMVIYVKPNALEDCEIKDDLSPQEILGAQEAPNLAAERSKASAALFAADVAAGYLLPTGELTATGRARRATMVTDPNQIIGRPPQ